MVTCAGGSGNTRSWISESVNGASVVDAVTDQVLSCDEMRHFWVTWHQGNLTVGRGNTLGSDVIMAYTDLELPYIVSAAAFSTPETAGEWRILREQG